MVWVHVWMRALEGQIRVEAGENTAERVLHAIDRDHNTARTRRREADFRR